MNHTSKLSYCAPPSLLLISADAAMAQEPQPAARPPIPGQLAQDFTAGRVPRLEEIEAAEKISRPIQTTFP